MNFAILKKTILIIGILLILLSVFMIFSHVKYGFEVFVPGIFMTLTGTFIPVNPTRKKLKQDYVKTVNSFPNIIQSVVITGIVILGMLTVIPMKLWLNNFISKEASMLIGYIFAFGVLFLYFHSIKKNQTGRSSFNMDIENKRIIPFLIIGSIVLLFGIISPIGGLIPMPEDFKKSFIQLAGQKGVYTFILMVIAAPVLEELIFRGIILEGLLKKYSPLTSIIISSLLFGIAHFNPWQFVIGLIIGIFSGWVYYKTRSLMPSIIIHAAANFWGFLSRHFTDSDSIVNQDFLESCGGLTNLMLLIICSIIIVSICIFNLKKEFIKMEIRNGSTQQHAIKSEFDTSLSEN